MKNISDKLTDEEYERNFEDMNPPFTPSAALTEAARCLYCYDAPCTRACPTAIDVPSFIQKISTQNNRGSAKVILEANIMGATCARVCPVDVLCEGACVYLARGEKPIQIGRLQKFATDWASAHDVRLEKSAAMVNFHCAVLGAGPAGLGCAAELAKAGYRVTIFEKKPLPGGLGTYGMASYKMRPEVSVREAGLVEDLGVEIQTGVEVGREVTFQRLEQEFDAVFIAVGLGPTRRLRIPGEDLDGVHEALRFIESFHTAAFRTVDVGKKVIVIGCGNTAIDAATQAKRLGAERVTIVYRRSEKEMPAFQYEYNLAKSDGVQFSWLTSPIRILGDGEVSGLKCRRIKLGEPDSTGRAQPVPIAGSEFILEADMIIQATGQTRLVSFLSSIPDLHLKDGRVVVDPETLQTGNPHYFAGGDCVNGGREVVDAVAEGKRAAWGIMRAHAAGSLKGGHS